MNFYLSISVCIIVILALKLKRGNELKERKTKVKTKVWKDVDEVVKATIEVPKRVQWLVEVMEEVPKGEKASS